MPTNQNSEQSESIVLYDKGARSGGYDPDTIDLMDLALYFLQSWKLILAFVLVGIGIAYGVTAFLIDPKYEATSTIYVLSRKDSAVNISDLQIGSALTQDYIQVFNIWEVHEDVIKNLDLPYDYNEMQSMLHVTNKSDTRMLDITVTSTDPKEAARIANEYARVSSKFIAETMSTEKPNIVSTALVPKSPVSPSLVRNVAMGGMIGLLVSCGILTVLHLSDDKIKVSDDIQKYTALTTLAIMPREDLQALARARRTYDEGKHAHAKSVD